MAAVVPVNVCCRSAVPLGWVSASPWAPDAASIRSSAVVAAGRQRRARSEAAGSPPAVAAARGGAREAGPDPAKDRSEGSPVASRPSGRRELILQSSSVALIASVFNFSGTRPSYLGVQRNPPSLALCPSTPNCISTSEELNDPGHYVPPWTYNPEDGRGKKSPVSQEQAMAELVAVVTSTKPDGFEPTIVKQTKDYLYVEYKSGFFGFVDDVEFWFPPGGKPLVEYRSASRLGEGDFDINRKRIRTLRKALEKYGWESVGF